MRRNPVRSAPALVLVALLAVPVRASASSEQPDCERLLAIDERSACEKRALADAEARYQREVEHCEAKLTPFLRDQLVAAEGAWRRDREIECAPGEGETRCLTSATRQRAEAILRTYPECAAGDGVRPSPESEGSPADGKSAGMLPARWTPQQGASQEVPFSFESLGSDTRRGTMHTTLGPGGEAFVGDYLRIEKSTKGELVTAMSIGWSGPEWQLWKHDPDGGWTEEGVSVGEFANFYTGKVIATLQGNRGHTMRCQIALKQPEAGLLAGGSGRCQVTDGGSLSLDF